MNAAAFRTALFAAAMVASAVLLAFTGGPP